MMMEELSSGLLLGLTTGVYCLGWCALVMAPHLASTGHDRTRSGLWKIVEFSAGRLIAYTVSGCLALAAGQTILSGSRARVVTGALVLVLALLVLLQGIVRGFPTVRWCAKLHKSPLLARYPLLGGFLSAAHVCPPLLLCLTRVATLGSAAPALAFGGGFFIGTTIVTLPVSVAAIGGRFPSMRATAAVASVFCGLWFAATGLVMLQT